MLKSTVNVVSSIEEGKLLDELALKKLPLGLACLQLDVEMAPSHPTQPIEARKEKCHLFPIYSHGRISETINNEAVHGRPDTRSVEIVITWRCMPGQLQNQRITAGYTPVARDDNLSVGYANV